MKLRTHIKSGNEYFLMEALGALFGLVAERK